MQDRSKLVEVGSDIQEVLARIASKPSLRQPRARTYLIVGGCVLALFAVFWLWNSGGANRATSYVTEKVSRGNLTVLVTATGTVQPTNKVDISSELSGTIRKVIVDHNSPVTVGQVLAELDTDKLKATADSARAAVAAAKAKIKSAEATVVELKLDYERKTTLVARSIVSDHDAQAAKAAYERALADVESKQADAAAAEANLRLAETNLAKTCICSPINGVVLSRNVEPGQIVASSLQAPVLFSIAEDLKNVEVQVDVDEADVGQVREGQSATFTVDAYPDKSFSATIRELRFGSAIVSGVVTYKAVLTTENPDLLLRPGMTATAEITVQKVENALTVPNAALRFSPPVSNDTDTRNFLQKLTTFRPPRRPASIPQPDGPNRKVWVLVAGEAKEMNVTAGPSDGKRTQILKGELQPGQDVIVDAHTTAR